MSILYLHFDSMTNPLVHAFFIGRAFAEVLGEQLEHTLTNALSELGRFDAEQRERLRQFTEQVVERARQEEELAMQNRPATTPTQAGFQTEDLQAMLDELRAEVARLRAELQNYRNRSS
jgi:molecular chaperone GrpE (heat shock protein)